MQWIDETALKTWAARTDARALMPDMIADLIRATIPDASRFRFPGGDSGQVRGWDGDLETSGAVSLVPAGKSKWEFGVAGGASKASSDYTKRTKKTAPNVMADNTLVLVNLQAWDTALKTLVDWEIDRKAEGKWRDVRYIDSVALIGWLDKHPAVAARYARDILCSAPKNGALSTDEYWNEYSLQFKPQLTEKLVIGDRQQIANELTAKLAGSAQSILLGAESSEEVIAFAVAAIRSADTATRRTLENKTFIVYTEEAARFFSQHNNLIFIAIKAAEPQAGALARKGPTLCAVTGVQARNHEYLQRQSASSMAAGFVSMGCQHDAGYELALRCGRSLTILKRLIPGGVITHPEWVTHATSLKPAFLAGGWLATARLDREILTDLGGYVKYSDLEDVLLPTYSLSDPPVDRVDDVRQVRAPVDAFHFYGALVSEVDLERLRNAVLKVFSHTVEGPTRDQPFSLTYTAPDDYSRWLRDGLALTLLVFAAMHRVGGLQISGKTPQQYVDEIVTGLPEWGRNHRTLLRLGDQTALIAEAAPNPFLTALESILEGCNDDTKQIFASDDRGMFAPASPHIEILWGLEVLAWDPYYLNRACLILAKLAEIDPYPDSNVVNRPINSLRAILLGWAPNTYASFESRVASIDLILSNCPQVGWQLLTKLLPKPHDFSSPTQKAKLRDVAPETLETMTFGLVWDFEKVIVDRAAALATGNESRIITLIGAFATFRPENRAGVLVLVDSYLSVHQSPEGSAVWHELKAELARHEYFADSDWALRQDELQQIAELVTKHNPSDPLALERYVFDEWMPHIGRYSRENFESVNPDDLRKDALDRILMREGWAGIVRLARLVKLPNLIGPALRTTSITQSQLIELFENSLDSTVAKDIAFHASAAGVALFGDAWKATFKARGLSKLATDTDKAYFLLGWPLNEKTWSFVGGLGDGVSAEYWRQIRSLPMQGSQVELIFAITQFRQHGRSIDVIGLLYRRIKDLPTELLLALFSEGHEQVVAGFKRIGNMLPYYIGLGLTELRTRNDAREPDIARLEYAYLPVLSDQEPPLTIFGILAKEPTFFVEVISHAFKAKNAPQDVELTDEAKTRARVAYRLLSQFDRVPGLHDGVVDMDTLRHWISGARAAAKSKELDEITDQYIGRVLAHAPINLQERFWPPTPISAVIELEASKEIEVGISVERFNMRGVVGKSVNEGGSQERQLAAQYEEWAAATVQFPRTSALMREIAKMWMRHADQEDTRAEKGKLKM